MRREACSHRGTNERGGDGGGDGGGSGGGTGLDVVPVGLCGGVIRAGFAGRRGGVSRPPFDRLNVAHGIGDLAWCVERNRRRLAGALGLPVPLLTTRQVHGTRVWWVDGAGSGGIRQSVLAGKVRTKPRADVLVTRCRDHALLMSVADCPAVILGARGQPLVALIHAGWRGALQGIIERTLEELRREGGLAPWALEAHVSPAIGACCFEIGDDVVARLGRQDHRFLVSRPRARAHLDLVELVVDRLARAGVPRSRLTASTDCTCCCRERYFSYRAERGQTGRNGVVAWID